MTIFAAIQMQPEILDITSNIKKVSRIMGEAAKKNVKFAVFPECCLSGYDLTIDEAKDIAIEIPGTETDELSSLCQNLDMFIVVGSIEVDEQGKHYNTAILIGPQGFIGKYRKAHLPFLGVDRFLQPGNQFPVIFETAVGKIGLMICWDIFYPEAARLHGLAGTQVIANPTAWMAGNDQYPEFVRARAAENDLYVIGTNWIGIERGTEYLGCSSIVGPSGEILAKASSSEEEILYKEINPLNTHRGRRIFIPGKFEMDLWNERRPDLYGQIVVDNRSK